MGEPIGVLGGGEFGRALAVAAARSGAEVRLWSRRTIAVDAPRVRVTTELGELASATLIFVAVPSAHVDEAARRVGAFLDGRHYLVHVSRGLLGNEHLGDELHTLTSRLRTLTPVRRVGALGGPLVASALRDGTPGGAIVGTRFPEVRDAVRLALAGPSLRIESTEDVVGVEIASAMVGLFALGAGCVMGTGGGPAALALYLSRAMEEATRLGVALGADARTFAGLAGVGDLIAAVAGDNRPEMRLGLALAEGGDLESAAARTGAYIEGVSIGARVAAFARVHGLKMPISTLLADLATGRMPPTEAAAALALGGLKTGHR